MKYAKLKGRITEICGTQNNLATQLGVTQSYISSRLNGRVAFDVLEISKMCKVLQIPIEEAHKYFFD